MNLTEKRRHNRLDKIMFVQYSHITHSNNRIQIFKAMTKDISPGGVKLSTNSFIPEKTQISVLASPQKIQLQARGEVVWVNKTNNLSPNREQYDIGLKFISIADTETEKIMRL